MNICIRAAVALGIGAISSPALAQSYEAVQGEKPSGFFTDRLAPHASDNLTADSISTGRSRDIDRSAKEDNVELKDR